MALGIITIPMLMLSLLLFLPDLSTDNPCPRRRYLVLLADTWLHIATSTVVFTEVSDSRINDLLFWLWLLFGRM